jgi:hypothetical protein
MTVSPMLATTSTSIRPEALSRDGKCRGCSNPTADCANCHGTGRKVRDNKPCMACKASGKKAFCADPHCKDRFYASRGRRAPTAVAAA